MKLNKQQITIINSLLEKRGSLKKKLDDNINHVSRIRRAMDKEKNQNAYWKLFDKVKIGERLVAEQTKKLNKLSIQEIATEAKVGYSTVKTHEAVLNGERDVRESLGIV